MLKKMLFFALILFVSFSSYSQKSEKSTVTCTQTVVGEFTTPVEIHDYIIELVPKQVLEVSIIPTGDYLNYRIQFNDPVDEQLIFDLGTFQDSNKRSITFKTGVLSGRGKYTFRVFNHDTYERQGRVGEYTIIFKCVN